MWLFEFHQPERDFWRFMNPRRFHALANAWYKPKHQEKKQPQKSLSEYLTGG